MKDLLQDLFEFMEDDENQVNEDDQAENTASHQHHFQVFMPQFVVN